MKRWTQIFKLFANINRVQVVRLLSEKNKMTVSEIAEKLDISLKATSKHLIMMQNADVLESKGKNNRVYYWLNPTLPKDLQKTINLFI